MINSIKSILVMILLCCLVGCRSDEDTQDDQEVEYALLQIMEEEILEIVDTECADVNACKYVAFGEKPCGGPWNFLIYSVTGTQESDLLQKVENFNTTQRLLNQKYGAISDCSVVLPPNLTCQDGNCQASE